MPTENDSIMVARALWDALVDQNKIQREYIEVVQQIMAGYQRQVDELHAQVSQLRHDASAASQEGQETR